MSSIVQAKSEFRREWKGMSGQKGAENPIKSINIVNEEHLKRVINRLKITSKETQKNYYIGKRNEKYFILNPINMIWFLESKGEIIETIEFDAINIKTESLEERKNIYAKSACRLNEKQIMKLNNI